MDNRGNDPESRLQQWGTVPVIADGLPRADSDSDSRLARCVYFVITAEEPDMPCILHMPRASIPFILMGLQGIIYRPLRLDSETFKSPNDWGDLVTFVEELDGFSVDIEYFWIPVDLLNRARSKFSSKEGGFSSHANRGDVFRLSTELFVTAWRAARDGVDFKDYAARVLDGFGGDRLARALTYSPEETTSIESWAIDLVRRSSIG